MVKARRRSLRSGFRTLGRAAAVAIGVWGGSRATAAITFGQLDDFQNGTVMSWAEGVASPNPPTNSPSGGPRGEGDAYLRNDSAGGSSAGGRMVMFNQDQWTGDYNAAGVTRIDASLANLGSTPLFMRVTIASGTTLFGSTQAVELPPDGAWRRVTFDLTGGSLTKVQGTETLGEMLGHVVSLRLLSAEAGPSNIGDGVAATLGADDLRALRLPGDANFDGRTDSTDYRITRLNVGDRDASWSQGDFNFDGRVNSRDLALLRRHLGTSIPAGAFAAAASPAVAAGIAPVPEPAAAALLGLATAAVLLHRRRAS